MSTTTHLAADPNPPSPENNAAAKPEDVVPGTEAGQGNVGSSTSDNVTELPSEWVLPDAKGYWNEAKNAFTEDDKTQAWAKLADAVKNYSDETVKRWNSEIDTLLVYAGLFSAILTAFNVQSYSMLTPQSPDPVLDTLERISMQLNSFTLNEHFVNATLPATTRAVVPSPSTSVPKWAVWLNALWFSSLIFSLSAASVGILVKQWLNEYSSGLSGNSRQTARLRQHRLNNLIKWRVEAIVAFLPVLLQVALVLFFAGLLVLLWHLNRTVASIATFFIGVLLLFTIATTVLPSIVYGCSYVSPASRAVFEIIRIGTRPIAAAWLLVYTEWEFHQSNGRLSMRRRIIPDFVEGLAWSARERKLLEDTKDKLDAATIVTAYRTTMDVSYLNTATPCILELDPAYATSCFVAVDEENVRHRGQDVNNTFEHWTYQTSVEFDTSMVLLLAFDEDHILGGRIDPYLYKLQQMCDPLMNNRILTTLTIWTITSKHLASEKYLTDILREARDWLKFMDLFELPLNIMTRRCLALAASRLISHHHSTPNPSITEVYVRALDILLMTCIPTQAKEEVDPEESKTVDIIRAYTRHAFMDFGNALFLRQWTAYKGDNLAAEFLLDTLRIHGSGCGVLTRELVQGLSRLLDACEGDGPHPPFFLWDDNEDWIRGMRRSELGLISPQQNVGQVQEARNVSDAAMPSEGSGQDGHDATSLSIQAGSEDANAPPDACETPVLVLRATSAAVERGSSDSAVVDPSPAAEPSLNSDAYASSVAGQPGDYGGSSSEPKPVDGCASGPEDMPLDLVETAQLASGFNRPSSASPQHTNVNESLHHVPPHVPEVVEEAPPTSSDTAEPYVSLPLGGTPVRASSESAGAHIPQAISQTPHAPSNADEHPRLALSPAECNAPETMLSGEPRVGADGSNESDAHRPSGGGLHRTPEGVAPDAGNPPVAEVTADAGSSPTPPQGTDTTGSHVTASSEARNPAAMPETAGGSEREAESASASESDGGPLAAGLARDPATRSVARDGVAPSAPPGAYVDAGAGEPPVGDPRDRAGTTDERHASGS